MYKVIKRDGAVAEFDIAKISAAISKAFDALNKQTHPTVIDLLALKVTSDFESKIKDGLIAVEDIQDSVESVLCQAGYGEQVYNLFDVYEIEAVQALVPEQYEEFADALMALATEGGGL